MSVDGAVRGTCSTSWWSAGSRPTPCESYQRDLRRYAGFLAGAGQARPRPTSTALDVAEFRGRAARRGRRAPAARGQLGRPGGRRGPRAARVRAHGRADRRRPGPRGRAARRRPGGCPRRSPSTRSSGCSTRPGRPTDPDPRVLRDRALLEFLYGTGARISEAIGLDVDDLDHLATDPAVLLTGKGGKQRYVPVGRYAVTALDAYLVRGRPALAGRPRQAGRAPPCSSTPAAAGSPGRARGGSCAKQPIRSGKLRCLTAHPAALLRHPPARRRRRHPRRAGVARTRLGDHHPGLHSGDGGQAERGLRRRASRALSAEPRSSASGKSRTPTARLLESAERRGLVSRTVRDL